jgi:hypothetical protein
MASTSGISWVMWLRLPPVSEQASGVPASAGDYVILGAAS